MKLLFIGAGNMGQAIINGILKNKLISSNDVYIYEINEEIKKNVVEKYDVNILDNIDKKLSQFEMIILAIKPQIFMSLKEDNVLSKIPELIEEDQIIISIMAGVTLTTIRNFINHKNIIRIMPNTPALIGESMSVISCSEYISEEQLKKVADIFESIGKIEIMEEKYIDAVTAVSGSGPAYVFTFVEALTQGGVYCGLSKSVAEKLAVQTLLGSVKMILSGYNPEDLRHKVASPGGTTIEALATLERKGFRSAVIDAVKAAYEKSKILGS